MSNGYAVEISPLEQHRFGIISARADCVSAANIEEMLQFCLAHQVRFLIARCSTSDISAAQGMERSGFLLMDTLVYYKRSLVDLPAATKLDDVQIRPIEPEDEVGIRAVAGECFKNYGGHYHSDPLLRADQCDETYVAWAVSLCHQTENAHRVIVAVIKGVIVGFGALKMRTPVQGEGVLFGVHPLARGKGLYRRFMLDGMQWCRSRGAMQMIISTQITNIPSQSCWLSLGFVPYLSLYTFHKWFDQPKR